MQNHGHVKIIRSGERLEVWQYEKESTAFKRTHSRKAPRRSRSGTVRPLRLPSLYTRKQRKNSFTRLVRSAMGDLGAPALLTLTMRDLVHLRVAYRLYSVFTMRLRRKFPGIAWIAVPEFQKRGAVHFHVLLWGLPKHAVRTERKTRTIATVWGHGFVDIVPTNGASALVGYLSKYLSKQFADYRMCGARSYSASRNIPRPQCVTGRAPLAYSKELWGIEFSTDTPVEFAKEYGTKWLGSCSYKVYNLKQ